jgi:hypothetical protein
LTGQPDSQDDIYHNGRQGLQQLQFLHLFDQLHEEHKPERWKDGRKPGADGGAREHLEYDDEKEIHVPDLENHKC